MTPEPYAGMLKLLFADLSPQEAADCLKPMLWHRWEDPVTLPASATEMLVHFRDDLAWQQRFEAARNSETRIFVASHFLYRAAAHIADDSIEAAHVLCGLARHGVKRAFLAQIAQRECEHCIELRARLESREAKLPC